MTSESRISDALAQARWFADRGCSVIPIDHPADAAAQADPSNVGKTPTVAWKAFQSARPSDEHLSAWFGNGRQRNIGVITGAVSNLVVVDCDSAEAVTWADAHLARTTWRVRTSKGEHRGYRHPGVPVGNKVRIDTGDPAIKIDVRGDGGYVVAPGSEHASGARYEWIGEPPSIDALPVFDPEWLASKSPSGTVPIATLPMAVSEGSRNDTLFTEGCRLRRLGWSETEITASLSAVNVERCKPPLDVAEVETIARSCVRYDPAADLFPLSEAGDAECFADLHQTDVRFDHHRGRWLITDKTSGIWVPDPVERLTQLAVEAMRLRQQQANAMTDADEKKKTWLWAFRGESQSRINSALKLARSVPPLNDDGLNWDKDPFLLGTQNGVVDLRTGTFRKAVAADRVTMRVRADYDPAATCPLWLETLENIFAPSSDTGVHDFVEKRNESRRVVGFMQRALGYSITGDCREECCFFTWGEGGNGKGTVMNTLGWLLGDYTDDMPYSTLERSDKGGGIPNDVAKLADKRFITCGEVNEFNINESRLKALTGRDPITARFLHKEFFTFIPVCKIWIATNRKPKIVGQDDGIWRRIHLIPFTQKFEGRENKQLKDQLRIELPGILNWVIEGTRLWLRDGLQPPETVQAATAAYRQESNPVTPFIESCCVTGKGLRAQALLAFKAYEEFCVNERIEPWLRLSNKAFYRAMEQRFEKIEIRDGAIRAFYVGVGLKTSTTGGQL